MLRRLFFSSAKSATKLPVEILIQIFQELWALLYDGRPIGGEELATYSDMYYYFHDRRTKFLSLQDAIGLASIRKDYPKLLEKEVLDHATIILPLGYITPGWKDKDYNEGWDEPVKIGGLHLLSRHCEFGFQSPSSPKPESFQGHKSFTHLFDAWDYNARSVGVLISHLLKFGVSSLEETNIIYHPGKNPCGSNIRSDLWKYPFNKLQEPMWEMDFLNDTLLELGDKNGGKGSNLKKINVEVWGLNQDDWHAKRYCFTWSSCWRLEVRKANKHLLEVKIKNEDPISPTLYSKIILRDSFSKCTSILSAMNKSYIIAILIIFFIWATHILCRSEAGGAEYGLQHRRHHSL